jgi:hypothetical protein
MMAYLTRLRLPVGDKAPRLTPEYVVQLLQQKGVKYGILQDAVTAEVQRILTTPGYDDEQRMRVLIARGIAPISGRSARPKLLVDPKIFESSSFVMARKGEVIAKAENTAKGQDGFRVTGERIEPLNEESAKLTVGTGIEVQSSETETRYVVKETGRLFYDQGIRWRVDAKAIPLRDGLDAGIEIMPKSFSGAKISAEDLLSLAPHLGIRFGLLTSSAIETQIKSMKKWPSVITIARGVESSDGRAGEVVPLYKNSRGTSALDQERVKSQIVFPGEEVLLLKGAQLPQDGQTAFGETIRGRAYNELAVYPGRGIAKEKRGEDIVFKATTYGRVSLDKDRINVLNVIELSKDLMEVTIDLFPQQPLSAAVVIAMLRERDVLFGYEKDELEGRLLAASSAGQRVPRFVLARGRGATKGLDARIDFKFDPEEFKQKGIFQKKTGKTYFALPGDLLMVKYLPVEEQEGTNVLREKRAGSKKELPKDIAIEVSDRIDVIELGEEGSEKDPLRLEYRSAVIGLVNWSPGKLDVKPALRVSQNENEASLSISCRSDFGSLITQAMIQKLADEEGIRVDLNWSDINKAIAASRVNDGEMVDVVIAKSVEPQNGADSRIQYFVEFNGRPIEEFLGKRSGQDPKPELLDCVRPGDALAVKTPAGNGVDGKNIFGRRIPADRGKDEAFLYGHGIDRSKDGLQIFCNLSYPGYVLVEQGRMVIRSLVQPSKDKMSASISLYSSRSNRFQIREDKVVAMIQGAGIKVGIKEMAIRDAVMEVLERKEPILNLQIAEGRKPSKGRDSSFKLAVDLGSQVGTMREDGSIDFKNKNLFHTVKVGQLLMIKQPPSLGDEGSDIYGNKIPASPGRDGGLQAGSGVELAESGLEYRAAIDGVLEVSAKTLRVIPGILVNSDVGPKTGNIDAAGNRLIVRGSILPDFEVQSDKEIVVEKVAEGCRVKSKSQICIRGGIVGLNKALITSEGDIETLYITSDAQVEAGGTVKVGSEILHSRVICRGDLICTDGAGAIVGGEIVAYKGLRCKTLGTLGSEASTVVILGEDRLGLRQAEREMEESGLAATIRSLQGEIKTMTDELRLLYQQVLAAGQDSPEKAADLNTSYRLLYEKHRAKMAEAEALEAQRQEHLARYPFNSAFVLTVTDTIHPGTILRFKGVQWAIKDAMRSVEIRWNVATSNFTSRRI